MKSSEVRQKFIQYFEKNGHQLVASSSLLPDNDPTLLFTNAGMNQFKNLFLGLEKRNYQRAVSSQKCVRAGGKHNDLDNVGFTARHHTFFEMLGNFSFGDYFKKETIHFAWEFLTKGLGIPKDRLYVSVFQNDDEAANLWHRQEGIPKDRIFRFGEKDNFWRMGETGPCGPCTEIFYDHGPKAGADADAFKGISSGGDRFVEIWNLVLMQFFEKSPGVMEPLPKPSVDTGAGLERLTAAMQGKINNYDTDLFMPLIERGLSLLPREADLHALLLNEIAEVNLIKNKILFTELDQKRAALRVLADHTRSGAFLIADGTLPSNEGRGYVLRRILRRAIRYGRKLSSDQSFLLPMIDTLLQNFGTQYPELRERRDIILSTVKEEESRFLHTLDMGTEILFEELKKLKTKTVPGELVFKLYDTFGFPVDLTRLMSVEKGFQVDEDAFEKQMDQAKVKAKSSWKGQGLKTSEAHLISWTHQVHEKHGATLFSGYEALGKTLNTKILALSDGEKEVTELSPDQSGLLITKESIFYPEGGGQAGDHGLGYLPNKSEPLFYVENTSKLNDIYLHHISIPKSAPCCLTLSLAIDLRLTEKLRRNTAAHHSATHLLHSSLRKYLGTHVTQAGSLVNANRLRFDFTHNKALTPAELEQIENEVNAQIDLQLPVSCTVMSHKDAISQGAMALFGEKYGDQVRVVTMGGFSTELCGGTHVTNTSEIRLFKILSEGGVSSGVRRIEALAGETAFQFLNQAWVAYQAAAMAAQVAPKDFKAPTPLVNWIEERKLQVKNLERSLKHSQIQKIDVEALIESATLIFGTGKLVFANLPGLQDREAAAEITDRIKSKIGSGIVVTLADQALLVSITKDLLPRLTAGQVMKELTQVMGGKGGGRPDFAQGAVNLPEQFVVAQKRLVEFIQTTVK